MTDSTDAIDNAIQSAESLFASLLDRSPTHVSSDPESSLVPTGVSPPTGSNAPISPEASIASIGMASLGPGHLTAHAHAVYEDFDPRESLSAIGEINNTFIHVWYYCIGVASVKPRGYQGIPRIPTQYYNDSSGSCVSVFSLKALCTDLC